MVEPAHPPTNIRISRIVVGKPPQLLKSDVPKPVPVIIEITLNEANLRASKNGTSLKCKYIETTKTTNTINVKNNFTWSSLNKFLKPFFVIAK